MRIVSRTKALSKRLVRFYTGKSCKNGHLSERYSASGRCVECYKARQKRYKQSTNGKIVHRRGCERYSKTTKGKALKRKKDKKYKQSAKGRVSSRKYWKSNKGKAARRRANKKYQQTDKRKAVLKRYTQTDKGKSTSRRSAHARRARILNVKCVPFTYSETLQKFDLFENACAYCGSTSNLTEDHFMPISKGGPHRIENIIPACKSCNSSKRDIYPKSWFEYQTFYSRRRWNKIVKHTQY